MYYAILKIIVGFSKRWKKVILMTITYTTISVMCLYTKYLNLTEFTVHSIVYFRLFSFDFHWKLSSHCTNISYRRIMYVYLSSVGSLSMFIFIIIQFNWSWHTKLILILNVQFMCFFSTIQKRFFVYVIILLFFRDKMGSP